MNKEMPDDLAAVATSFSALMKSVEYGPNGKRSHQDRTMLTDRLRDALDRRVAYIDGQVTFIANTFKFEELAHHGLRSEIWRVRHRDLSTLHAIKTVPERLNNDPVIRDLLVREGQIGMTLQHENVAATRMLLRLDDGRPALLVDWMDESLEAVGLALKLRIGDIYCVIDALLVALDCVHRAGFVHGDVTPRNLVRSRDKPNTWRLADFGIALAHGQTYADLDITRAGSPQFVAPEQMMDGNITAATDIFAVGRLLSFSLAHCVDEPSSTEPLWELSEVFSRNEPERRPPNAKTAASLLARSMLRR
jgi:type VI secretion system protein ImpN